MKSDCKIKYPILTFFIILSMIFFTLTAWAAQNFTVNYLYVTSNAQFYVYRAGDINSDGSFVLSGRFADYSVSIDSTSAAAALADYAQRDGIAPNLSVKTNDDNTAVFSGLEKGVYLITGESVTRGRTKYTALPVLVAVGNTDNDVIIINGKFESQTVPAGGSSTGGGGGSSSSSNPKELSVMKVWSGGKSEESVTAQLLKNGKVYDEVVLNSENNWRHTWKNISRTDNWSVVEKEVPKGYEVSIDRDGTVFVITNTVQQDVPDNPDKPDNPVNPDNPNNPITPVNPDNPTDPDNPINPDNPNEPYNPENPNTSGGDNGTPNNTYSDSISTDRGSNDVALGTADRSELNSTLVQASDTGDELLPQTGQLWWPAAVFGCFGVMLIIIGLGCKRVGK